MITLLTMFLIPLGNHMVLCSHILGKQFTSDTVMFVRGGGGGQAPSKKPIMRKKTQLREKNNSEREKRLSI